MKLNSPPKSLHSNKDEEEKVPKTDSKQSPGIKSHAISKNKDKQVPKRSSNTDEDQSEKTVEVRYREICNILVEKGKMIAKFKDAFVYI